MRLPTSLATNVAFACFTLPLFTSVDLRAQIAPGNLVVVRVGDGTAPLTNAAQPVFVDEYTTAGTLVQSVALPTAATGGNQPFANSGTATSEGFLQLSADGAYLICTGYAATPGTPSIASTASATTPRVIARIARSGSIDTSTALSDAFSGNNIRSATSDDGMQFWASGANGGIRFATLGATTSTSLNSTAPTNNRVVGIVGGQLYATSASGAFHGLSVVGSGLPVTSGQSITLLPGMSSTSGPSFYDFFFAGPSTLYVADDRTNGNGGIQKWTETAGTWSLQYTLAPATNVGVRGITGTVTSGIATLYATSTANQLVAVTDVGSASTVAVVASGLTNTVMRGVRIVETPGRIERVAHGCGQTTFVATGFPTIGGRVSATVGNVTGVAVIGLGFALTATPFCGCTIGHDWLLSLPTGQLTFDIPNNPTLLGARFGLQGAEALGLGGCPSPQITTTDTMIVTIR